MNKDQIVARLTENAVEAVALESQIQGVHKLYEAACLRGDNATTDTSRQQLHDLLDQKLDLKSANLVLVRGLASFRD